MKLQEQFDQLDTKVQEKYTADTAKGSMSLEQWAAKRVSAYSVEEEDQMNRTERQHCLCLNVEPHVEQSCS